MVLLAVFVWTSRHRRISVDSGTRQVMGTLARIEVVASDRTKAVSAIQEAFDIIARLESLMSDYDPNSQLSYVNDRAFLETVPVDDSVFDVLAAAKEYSRLSEGAFDITIGPVVQLWRQSRKTGLAPSPDALAVAKAAVGWQDLILDPENKTVRFAKQGMRLDLGGIAKGYAVDQAIESLRQSGLLGGLVDIGGNIRTFGTPARNAPHWQIGLQDPRDEQSLLMVLILDDKAVATSGDYRRFAVIDGQRFSHIINPQTAQSAQALSSVTIIAPTAMQADALSTIVTILEEAKGLALIDSDEGIEAVIVKEGKLIKSRNVEKYLKTR